MRHSERDSSGQFRSTATKAELVGEIERLTAICEWWSNYDHRQRLAMSNALNLLRLAQAALTLCNRDTDVERVTAALINEVFDSGQLFHPTPHCPDIVALLVPVLTGHDASGVGIERRSLHTEPLDVLRGRGVL